MVVTVNQYIVIVEMDSFGLPCGFWLCPLIKTHYVLL